MITITIQLERKSEKYYVGVFGDLEKNQLIEISIKSKVKVATIRIAIDKKSTDILMRTSLLTTFSLKVKVGIYSQL